MNLYNYLLQSLVASIGQDLYNSPGAPAVFKPIGIHWRDLPKIGRAPPPPPVKVSVDRRRLVMDWLKSGRMTGGHRLWHRPRYPTLACSAWEWEARRTAKFSSWLLVLGVISLLD